MVQEIGIVIINNYYYSYVGRAEHSLWSLDDIPIFKTSLYRNAHCTFQADFEMRT